VKKIALLIMLLVSAFVLMANSWDNLSLINVHVPPQYAGNTRYDYQSGGYNGWALRIQDEAVPTSTAYPRVAVMTFMKKIEGSNLRRQVRSVMKLATNPQNPDGAIYVATLEENINTLGAHEGFGTLAMDPVTGTPIYAWHSWAGAMPPDAPPQADPLSYNADLFINTEQTAVFSNMFARNFSAPYRLYDNAPNAIDPLNNEYESYQWPLVHIGPSPDPDKRRVYVFASNGGSSLHMELIDPPEDSSTGNMPSSAEILIYADVDDQFFEDGLSFDPAHPDNNDYPIVWSTPQKIPYFWAMHNYNPIVDFPNLCIPDETDPEKFHIPTVRSFGSVAVQKDGPGVAYAGELSGGFHNGTVWADPNIGDHEFYVVYNNAYGHPDHWTVIPFDLSSRTRISTDEGYGMYYTKPDKSEWSFRFKPNPTEEEQDTDYFWKLDVDNMRVHSWGLGHKTIFFDENGHINFPVIMADSFTTEGKEYNIINGSYYHGHAAFMMMCRVNPTANPPEISLFPIYPRPEPDLMMVDAGGNYIGPVVFPWTGTPSNPPKAPFSWDQNMDGWFDDQFHNTYEWADENGGPSGEFFSVATIPSVYPVNHPDNDTRRSYSFHADHVRTTEDCDGVMVAMWVDSVMAGRAEDYPTFYPEWINTPEVMISASMDHGVNWTYPYSLNSVEHPEIFPVGKSPEYVYPADKIIRLSSTTFRLYFMVVNDWSYGSFEQGLGFDEGADIEFMALDFRLNPDGELIPDFDTAQTVPPPAKMLSQNYPNPFNPSTTIKFNLPNPGNVKLSVYNIKGQLVKTLVDDFMPKDSHEIVWHGTDNNDRSVASGVYFYRLSANGRSETKKMLLMK